MPKFYSEPEKIIYLVRHGRSEDNAAPVFQSPNSPLDELGKQQANKIAERVSKLSFDKLISSPFQRAKETAATITTKCNKVPEYSEIFVERVKPSSINGKPVEDETANKTWREWEKSLYTQGMKVEDGENYDDLISRADKALTFLSERTEKTIVVVSHGYFIRTLLARVVLGELVTPETFKKFQKISSMENTAISAILLQGAFEEEKRWRLWIYNDHSHLG